MFWKNLLSPGLRVVKGSLGGGIVLNWYATEKEKTRHHCFYMCIKCTYMYRYGKYPVASLFTSEHFKELDNNCNARSGIHLSYCPPWHEVLNREEIRRSNGRVSFRPINNCHSYLPARKSNKFFFYGCYFFQFHPICVPKERNYSPHFVLSESEGISAIGALYWISQRSATDWRLIFLSLQCI